MNCPQRKLIDKKDLYLWTENTEHMITPLKRMLFEREITNTELAKFIGLTRTNTGKIVNGDTVPGLVVAMTIARYLGTTVEDLWGHLLPEEDA